MRTLNDLVAGGKIRYLGCSNFAAWQLMKSLSVSEKQNLEKYVVYQGYYSLIGCDYEQELMPLLKDQQMGLMVWSPLGWGRLGGKIRRDQPLSEGRIKSGGDVGAPPVDQNHLYDVVDVLEEIAAKTSKTIPEVAINWLLRKDTVSSIVIGARNEQQLLENLKASDWMLSVEQIERLDKVSYQTPLYPHWVGER